MAIEGKRTLLGEYKIIDTKNPQNSKTFWGKNAEADAKAYGKMLVEKQKKTLVEKQKKTPKLTESEKKIQSQLKLGGYFKDPSTGVDTIDSLRAGGDYIPERFKKSKPPIDQISSKEKELNELKRSHKRNQDPRTQAVIKIKESELEKLYSEIDTTGYSAPKVDAAEGGGGILASIANFFSGPPEDELTEDQWKARRRSETQKLVNRGEIKVPEGYKGTNYDYARDLVDAAWKQKMEKPAVQKKVSEMSSQELKDFLDAK